MYEPQVREVLRDESVHDFVHALVCFPDLVAHYPPLLGGCVAHLPEPKIRLPDDRQRFKSKSGDVCECLPDQFAAALVPYLSGVFSGILDLDVIQSDSVELV